MITLRVSQIEDLIELANNALDPGIDTRPEEVLKWARKNMDYGPAYTALNEGKIVAAGGVWLVRPGVGLNWIVISKDVARTYTYDSLREGMIVMRNMTDILAETFELKKIRAISRIGFRQSQSMLEHLGFERLRRSRKSYYIYRRRF